MVRGPRVDQPCPSAGLGTKRGMTGTPLEDGVRKQGGRRGDNRRRRSSSNSRNDRGIWYSTTYSVGLASPRLEGCEVLLFLLVADFPVMWGSSVEGGLTLVATIRDAMSDLLAEPTTQQILLAGRIFTGVGTLGAWGTRSTRGGIGGRSRANSRGLGLTS